MDIQATHTIRRKQPIDRQQVQPTLCRQPHQGAVATAYQLTIA
jgi:hypothetical protein